MFLRRLTLEDFRQFRGKQELDFSIDLGTEKNIVLVGGLNGAGKTSVLEALQLALFGPLAKHLWSDVGYEMFIRDALNRDHALAGGDSFRLSIELETESHWGMNPVSIIRQWHISSGGTVQQTLRLLENEQPVAGDEQDWEDQIQTRFPVSLSPFFFFDGEKIQMLAGDEGSEARLGDAIKRLLNVESYETLETDLITYERNLRREASRDDLAVASADAQAAEVTGLIQAVDQRTHRLLGQIKASEVRAQSTRAWLIHQGSRAALRRVEIEKSLEKVRRKKEELQGQLAQFVGQTLPAALLTPLMSQLQAQLRIEEEQERNEILQQTLRERRDWFFGQLENEPTHLVKSVKVAWERVFPTGTQATASRMHSHMSTEDRRSLLGQLQSLKEAARTRIGEVVDQLDTVDREIRRFTQETKSIPVDPAFLEKEEELHQIDRDRGAALREIGVCEVERKDLENRLKALERERNRLLEQAKLAERNERKVQESIRTRKAIRTYVDRLKKRKLDQVAYHLTTMFRQLHRKTDYVRTFEIDPTTLRVTLRTHDDRFVDKRQLSAGEKEIYAISLLWALSKASEQDLPVVIDTPLGRLDSVHREHIAEHYLPSANRQVILLSTDTEFDQHLYGAIESYVARAQTLVYDRVEKRTTVRPGYLFGGS